MTKHSKIFSGDQDFSSMQMKGVEQIEVKVDLDGAAKRLSKAV